MNYIYDIYLNLNEKLYDFFDWNKGDKIIHIKKIPIVKTNENSFKKLIINKIRIEKELLNKIYNKTEVWNTNEKLPYCTLFTDASNFISIEFDSNGNSIKKSFLSIDEEFEVIEIANRLKESKIDFIVLNKEKKVFKTRKQIKDEKFINKELKNMDEDKLNYIFFECFGTKEKDRKTILNKINKISKNSKTYKNLYDILKLTSTSKNT